MAGKKIISANLMGNTAKLDTSVHTGDRHRERKRERERERERER